MVRVVKALSIRLEATAASHSVALVVTAVIAATLVGIAVSHFGFLLLVIPMAGLALSASIANPPLAVLGLLSLQSLAFNKSDEIDVWKMAYFALYLLVLAGWLIASARNTTLHMPLHKLFRRSSAAMPLLLFLIDLLLTILMLVGTSNADYFRWIRQFSLYSGYALFYVIGSTVQSKALIRRILITLWAIGLTTGVLGILLQDTLPVTITMQGQMSLLTVALLGVSFFQTERRFLLRLVFLTGAVAAPLLWLLPSFFSQDANELSFVLALTIAAATWLSLTFVVMKQYRGGLTRLLFVLLFAISVILLLGIPIVPATIDLASLEYTHRGDTFSLLDPSSILSLPTMAIRLAEVEVVPKYLARSPIFGLGLTFAVPDFELVDAYGRLPDYFTGYMHNGYLSMLLRVGILGTILFLLAIVGVMIDSFRLIAGTHHSTDDGTLAYMGITVVSLLVAILIYSVVASRFDDRGATSYIGILAGLTAAGLRLTAPDESTSSFAVTRADKPENRRSTS
jgi:hypothetical protein